MLHRLLRSTIVFVAVLVAYQVYLHTAVPVLEPPVKRRASQPVSPTDFQGGRNIASRYQQFLANYFPAGHWSLVKSCIVIESGPVMLVLSDYQRHNDGRIDLEQCAVLLLPAPRQEGMTPPRDAVVLEAPAGAKLQFDDHFDPSRGQIGRLVRGEFPGAITIRSDMREPGPQDDLLVATSDLRMNESVISTEAEVNVRLGENVGRGKRLEIRFVKDPHAQFKKNGLAIAGVQSLEIFEQVQLSLKLDDLDLLSEETAGVRTVQAAPAEGPYRLPSASRENAGGQVLLASNEGPELGSAGGDAQSQTEPRWEPAPQSGSPGPGTARLTGGGLAAAPSVPKPPLEVTCTGPFSFDFLNYKATFLRNVEITQLNLSGPSDQLSCQELNIYFASLDENGEPVSSLDEPDVSRRQRADLRRLEPTMLEAIGNPVVVLSPIREAEARGQRLRLTLRERKLKLDGGRVMLAYGPNEIHAPLLQYQHPEPEAASQVGKLWIAGPGWMRAVPSPDKPNEIVETRWERVEGAEYSVRLTRKDGQPVLSLIGQPRITAPSFGQISANQMHVYLKEVPADGPEGPALEVGRASDGVERLAILPDRLAATGRVEIHSPQLTGRTDELLAWFQSVTPAPQTNAATVSQPTEAADESKSNDQSPGTTYDIGAAQIRLELALVGRQALPKNLSCEGQVVFRETSAAPGGEEPLVVRGEQVRVEGIDQGARITVAGGGSGNDVTRGNATIAARGMNLAADKIHLDQQANRMWIDGPGETDLSVTRDLLGQETAGASYPVHIRWRGGLEFDGQTIELRDDVFAEGPHDWLHTKRLSAKLSHPVKFGEGAPQPQQAEVAEIVCSDGVAIDHRTVDVAGQQSHERAQLHTLTINQITGAIGGNGPGWVRSVHYGQQASSLFADPTLASSRPQNKTKLNFLRVDFLRGISGNLKSRTIRFQGQVRVIYGPVDAWEQELTTNGPGGLPEGAVTLECEELQVNEDPLARRAVALQPDAPSAGPFEVLATGNVRIEGGTPEHGDFTAIAHAVSFNQYKDVFVLKGNGQLAATLHRTGKDGAAGSLSFGAITFYPKTNRASGVDLKPSTINFSGQRGRPSPQR